MVQMYSILFFLQELKAVDLVSVERCTLKYKAECKEKFKYKDSFIGLHTERHRRREKGELVDGNLCHGILYSTILGG